MKISFRKSDDGVSVEIYLDDKFIGAVMPNLWTQKWSLKPDFRIPHNFSGADKKEYDCSYAAGKELIRLYKFFFPLYNEEEDNEEFGIDLSEILSFLKTRI